jgi:hypothetical protein
MNVEVPWMLGWLYCVCYSVSAVCSVAVSYLTDLADLVLAAIRSHRAQLGGIANATCVIRPVLNYVVL